MSINNIFRFCKTGLKNPRIYIVVVLVIVVYFGYLYHDDKEVMLFRHTGGNTPCVLPDLDPFDPKMMEYVWNPPPLVCGKPAIVYVDVNNNLQYNLTALHLLNEKSKNIKCKIYLIKRILDNDIEFEEPFLWKPPNSFPGDFFRVKCTGSSGTLFDSTLAKIHKAERELQPLDMALAEDKYSVLLFGIDSLSRSSAVRQLPNTFRYLQSLGAYDMKGYMIVAANTFVNIAPLLSGYFVDELPHVDIYKDHIDNLPLLWRNFSKQKTATLFGEDMPTLAMFNMDKKGFLQSPTDHYMRPFWLANFKMRPLFNLRSQLFRFLEHNNMKLTETSALCLDDKPNHVALINYIKQFMLTYKNYRKFSFSFLTELSHEFQELLQLGDIDIMQFFKWLSDEGFLDNTILIMFSDHGLKFGNNQHLFVARMENRMPLLSIVIPESLKHKYPNIAKSLAANQDRLASAFDLHATLRDILNGNLKHPGRFTVNGQSRGVSLFQELPKERSCADAAIDEHFCACYKATKLNVTNNPLAEKIAMRVVDHINKLLSEHPECVILKLNKVVELSKVEQGLKYVGTQRRRNLWFKKNLVAEARDDVRHTVVLETVPGKALFYATCDGSETLINVIGSVDRINKYGNQSHCMKLHELKSLCYCAKQL